MDFLIPRDCAIDSATPYWLLVAMIALAVASGALVAQAGMLWSRQSRANVAWWRRLTPALGLAWAVMCVLLAAQAFDYYRTVTTPLVCPREALCSFKGLCYPVVELRAEVLVVLAVAAVALVLGWLALSRLARRARRVSPPIRA